MPIKEPNNDQNIERFFPKMSEECPSLNNNENLTERLELENNYINTANSPIDNKEDINLSYDHMYASHTETGEINPELLDTCQNTENEVRFLKEWLLMHLELIQQQNDDILSKEKTIYLLKRENEMLKERLNCVDRGIVFKTNTLVNNHFEDSAEEMTQDAGHIDDDNKHSVYLLEQHNSPLNNCLGSSNYESKDPMPVNTPQSTSLICDREIKNELVTCSVENKTDANEDCNSKDSPVHETLSNSILNFNNSYVVNSSMEETLKNMRMSIRRKRLCSTSSTVSASDTNVDESKSSRKKKKRKSSLKEERILTCNEQYVTTTGDVYLGITTEPDPPADIPQASNLEVPRWRVKVYTSCYAMEGTENLDDEVYNKRHMRLENDERRRKRWDVQRIREQRIVEKLKQRQERIDSGSKNDEPSEPEQSLWPTLEDIKFLEVTDQLPVSAFGAPVPRFLPSEFNLPWLNNPHASAKKTSNRKSTIRRKATKR